MEREEEEELESGTIVASALLRIIFIIPASSSSSSLSAPSPTALSPAPVLLPAFLTLSPWSANVGAGVPEES